MIPFRDPFEWHESYGRFLLNVRTGGYCTFDASPTNGLHAHDFFEACLITAGTGNYLHGTNRHALSIGDIILAQPSVPHEIESKQTRNLQLVFFAFDVPHKAPFSPQNEKERLIRNILNTQRIHVSGFRRLLGYLQVLSRDLRHDWMIQQILGTFLAEMLNAIAPPPADTIPAREKAVVDRALTVIDERIREPVQVSEVALATGVSDRSLRRYFQEVLGKTVVEVIRERKLNRATALLLMNFDVGAVAQMLAMETAHFSRSFKSHFGINPKDYKGAYAHGSPSSRQTRPMV